MLPASAVASSGGLGNAFELLCDSSLLLCPSFSFPPSRLIFFSLSPFLLLPFLYECIACKPGNPLNLSYSSVLQACYV